MGRKPDDVPLDVEAADQQYRRSRIEKMLLNGHTNKNEMAAAFHTNVETIKEDIKFIRQGWVNDDKDAIQSRIATRVRQLDHIQSLCLNEFELSKTKKEEVSVETKMCDYPNCSGGILRSKEGKGKVCPRCGGEGQITIERSKITKRNGDGRYLSIAKECIVECARIEGCYPSTASTLKKLAAETLGQDDPIVQQLEVLFVEGDYDKIIKAKLALSDARVQSIIETTATTVETKDDVKPGLQPPGETPPPPA